MLAVRRHLSDAFEHTLSFRKNGAAVADHVSWSR